MLARIPALAGVTPSRALLALVGAGVACVLLGLAIGGGDSLIALLGFVLLTHALLVVASTLPPGRISKRLDGFLDRWVADVAGGWYGLVALGVFAHSEAGALFGDLADFSVTRSAVTELLLPWLIGFSIESVWNMLTAGFWPLLLVHTHGLLPAMVFAVASWAAFYAGSRVFAIEPLPAKAAGRGVATADATQGDAARSAHAAPEPALHASDAAQAGNVLPIATTPSLPAHAVPPPPPAAPPLPQEPPEPPRPARAAAPD